MGRSQRARGRTTPRRRVDWSPAGGGAASNTAVAALGLAAAAATGHALDVGPFWGATAGVAGAATNVVVGAAVEASPGGQIINIARWLGAGGWLTWCLATTPWDLNAMMALLVGSVVSAGLSPLTRSQARSKDNSGALVLSATSKVEREWEQRLARITRQGPFQVTSTEMWETGAGYTLTVELPSGVTRRSLGSYTDALAADAKLPEGCGVEPDRAPHRGAVRLHVATVDRMRETIDYPEDYGPRSILDPISLGEHRDSSLATVSWREHSAIIAGQKGSGKTTVLNVATAGVGRCTDALVWHIDLTGGGLSRAWLDPWIRGEVERPAIDWAVNTEQDALAMVHAALNISTGRKASAFEKKMAADTSLLPVDKDLPEIVLFVDEGKTLLSPMGRGITGQIRDGLEKLQDIARDSAVNPVLSTLRATSDTLSPAIKKQAVTRMGMSGSDDEEIAYLLGWKNLSVDDLAGPGTAFLTDGAPARPMRGYNLTPRRIAELSKEISARQPVLERPSQEAAGAAYANRYQRMRSTFSESSGQEVAVVEPAGPVAVPERPTLRSVQMDADSWLSDAPAAPAPAAEPEQGAGGADFSAWLTPSERARQHQDAASGRPAADWDGVPEVLTRALEVLDRIGDDRIHSEDLAEELGLSKFALSKAMANHGVATLPNKFSRGGQSRRGYGRQTIADVAERHRAEVAGAG